ncbi:MAG: CRISPR system precrRNA processing endoribonuclease RAMP protein Cas6, partial [Dehalococcoidia bacterium]|nr:CRISPR system precrRNA processing endoribonuclease RAMP protein Cas6 [Dehalococcoidia bacterium]
MDLRAYILQFDCLASTEIRLPPFKGSAIRGAFFSALRGDFCLDRRVPGCSSCQVRQSCPVSALLATVDESSVRGIEVARPCTIEPPLETQTLYRPGDPLSFGVTLFGNAWELLAYVVLGVRRMGEIGLGNRPLAPGRFSIQQIKAIDPISGRSQHVYSCDENLVRCPDVPVVHSTILSACESLAGQTSVTLELLTPMRLIADGVLVKAISFPVLARRILRRLTDLTRSACGSHPDFDHEQLLIQAETVETAEDRTHWVDVSSFSSRQGRSTPIGGLMGQITFEGDLKPFAPWLLWGTITHVG